MIDHRITKFITVEDSVMGIDYAIEEIYQGLDIKDRPSIVGYSTNDDDVGVTYVCVTIKIEREAR